MARKKIFKMEDYVWSLIFSWIPEETFLSAVNDWSSDYLHRLELSIIVTDNSADTSEIALC